MSKTYAVSVPDEMISKVEKLKEGTSELFQRAVREAEAPLVFAYPAAGGKASFPTGINTINLFTGSVFKADGTTDKLVGNLKEYRRDFARSLTVNPDLEVKVYTDQRPGNKWTVEAYDTPTFTHLEYQIIYIITTTTTNIRILASTHPEGIIRRFISVSESPTGILHGQTTVTTAGTAVQLQSTSQTIKSITVKAKDGNAGYIYVADSDVSSSNGFILGANAGVSLEINDISKIWINSSVSGEGASWIAVY